MAEIKNEEYEYKLKAMQGLLDGQAVVIKELEDELEQVKFALEVESHDNSYNKDKYKAIAEELADALIRLEKLGDAWQKQGVMGSQMFIIGTAVAKPCREALAKFKEMRK